MELSLGFPVRALAGARRFEAWAQVARPDPDTTQKDTLRRRITAAGREASAISAPFDSM